jgi:integrase
MDSKRISKRVVDSAHPSKAEYTIWDDALTGFGLRVRPSGAKSYVIVYRAGTGRKAPVRKVTLGAVGKLTPDDARKLAERALGSVAYGKDPAADRAQDREGLTVKELIEAFLADHATLKLKTTTGTRYSHLLRHWVAPELGSTKADALSRAAVAKLHARMKRRAVSANRMLGAVSSMYGFAQRRGIVPEGFNPASRIEKYSEQRRERFLTTKELGRIGDALREAETKGVPWVVDETQPNAKHIPKQEKNRRTVFGLLPTAALRLLLFSGCRLREILDLKWEYVDLERGVLLLPDSKTGRRTVVLNAPALAVLASLPRLGPYVVPADDPKRPRHDLKRVWSAVSRRAGLSGVRLRDLRHTYASFGAGGGLGLPIIGKLLGHSQSATTERYAHLDNDPLRRASEKIGGQIAAAMGDAPATDPAKIVPLKRGQARRRG